jgi:DHA3 family tetracycline resistance protein-like MFS transporter
LLSQGALALSLTMVFTVMAVYRVQVVGVSPLQLVLIGTVMEAAYFLLEMPTGIVADVVSRRLSVIIGMFFLGVAALIEGLFPIFGVILLSQVAWALGYAFTSGATEAWIADEVGEAAVGRVFLRGTQVRQLGTLLGTGLSVALASVRLNLPMLVGGGMVVALAALLALVMTEHGFRPLPREERSTWGQMGVTLRAGVAAVRGRPLLISLLGISAVAGMSSEGFDRLWQNHLLVGFTFPALGNLDPVVWFGIINAGATIISLVAVEAVTRWLRPRADAAGVRVLFWMYVLLCASVVAFGLARQFGLALAAFWSATTMRRASDPLYSAWLNRQIDSRVRATVLSMSSQCDALGQVIGGPIIGLIASGVSISAAMVVTGLSLAPVLLLFRQKPTGAALEAAGAKG